MMQSHAFSGFCEGASAYRPVSLRKSAVKEVSEGEWFARALWKAFPGCRSENDLAETVAAHMKSINRRACAKTVRNWLQKHSSPSLRHVQPVLERLSEDDVLELAFGPRINERAN